MHQCAAVQREQGKRIGVVPTMGFLHEGHLTLIRAARSRADTVITTVFVNPAQFGPGEDYQQYPRDLGRDITLAGDAGADVVFAPEPLTMYPADFRSFVNVESITDVLEGKSRPGHFRGVATVVVKLFNLTRPHIAVFGQKDAQQVAVVKQFTRDLNMDVEIVVIPIVREQDGLALSSRNVYLSEEQRREAPVLYSSLQMAADMLRKGERSADRLRDEMRRIIGATSGAIDYVSVANGGTLQELGLIPSPCNVLLSLAVRFGRTRLIDNVTMDL